MSEYLTLIPLIRELCFPCYHSCLEKKKKKERRQRIWETEISMFSFLFFFQSTSKCDLGSKHETSHSPPSLFIASHICHPRSILLLVCFCPASLFPVRSLESDPRPCAESSLSPSSMFSFEICFVSISAFIAGDTTAAVWFDRRHQFNPLPTLSGFSLSPSEASPSIFLFFLNVIVKCSSEMTLNMCTLTEGIHLVIYFLNPASCCLSMVSWSFCLVKLRSVRS